MYLLTPIIAWLTAQCLKLLIEAWRNRGIDLKRFWGAGGMPSSHAAGSVALTTVLWRDFGFNEPVVAVAFTFTVIVLYDAANIRRETGRQAEILNKMVEVFRQHSQFTEERLKELLGHTPLQVLAGTLLGFLIGYFM